MVDFDADLDRISDEMNRELRELVRQVERNDEPGAQRTLDHLSALAREFVAARADAIHLIGNFAEGVLDRATASYRELRRRQGVAPSYPPVPPPPRLEPPPVPGREVPGYAVRIPRYNPPVVRQGLTHEGYATPLPRSPQSGFGQKLTRAEEPLQNLSPAERRRRGL